MAWLDHPKFLDFAKKTWMSITFQEKKMHIFKEELELLKNKLKVLDVDVFGKTALGLEE